MPEEEFGAGPEIAALEEDMDAGGGVGSVLRFVALLCAVFIGAGWYVTDLQGGGSVSVGEGISAERGETIFWGTGPVDGACHTCHSIGERGTMKRCPNLGQGPQGAPIGERAAVRAKEREEQTGSKYTLTDYIIESVASPSAYVVDGFPDDLMPLTYTGQIDLEPEDLMSVIAYLQSLVGESDLKAISESMSRYGQPILQKARLKNQGPSVRRINFPYPEWEVLEPEQFAEYQKLNSDERKTYLVESLDEEQREILAEIEMDWIDAGRETFESKKCWQCHEVKGESFGTLEPGNVGPDLTSIGAIQGREYIVESILNPNALIVPPLEDHSEEGRSKMPSYAEQMGSQDLLNLAFYLSQLTGPPEEEAPEAGEEALVDVDGAPESSAEADGDESENDEPERVG